MKPSKAHLDTAQRIYDRLGRGSVADIDALAAALVAAHQDGIREGKRQAAEIARKHFDLRHADKARFASAAISSAILATITDESE